ncbi:MAG: phosphotransferase family protein [Sphingomonadales bacterium]|nr:phosphotransferase family protein [Sphingomonadales bacterium]
MNASVDMTGTITVPEHDRLNEGRLTEWMLANVEGFAGPLTMTKFAGGQSNPTYRIDSPSGAYVLRRKPFGMLLQSAHAVDREFAVIAGLYPTGFPVPRPYALCTDDAVVGSMFYVMGLVAGRTIWDGSLPDVPRNDRRATYEAMIDSLAALHSVDYEAAGLGGYGKPGNYFERQVGRWTKQYRASETEVMPDMEKLIEYLARTIPPQTRTSIVHGDYRIDNLIFAPNEPKVTAVLDWELSTLGDPLADVAYLLMNWLTEPEGRSGLLGYDLAALNIPTLDEAAARYCERTGRENIPDLNWYFAYNLFRLAGIVQGIKKRVIDGTASSAHAAETAKRVPSLAAAAWDFARKAGAQ